MSAEEQRRREQATVLAAFVGLGALAVAGWYVAPLLAAAVLALGLTRAWSARRRTAESHPVRGLAVAAVVGVVTAVAAVLAPAGDAGWVGRYDHRLRHYTSQEARQARAQAHRRARRHHRPYRAPATQVSRLTPWSYHARAALTPEVIARACALALGVALALAAAFCAQWERRRARAHLQTRPPRGGLTTTKRSTP